MPRRDRRGILAYEVALRALRTTVRSYKSVPGSAARILLLLRQLQVLLAEEAEPRTLRPVLAVRVAAAHVALDTRSATARKSSTVSRRGMVGNYATAMLGNMAEREMYARVTGR